MFNNLLGVTLIVCLLPNRTIIGQTYHRLSNTRAPITSILFKNFGPICYGYPITYMDSEVSILKASFIQPTIETIHTNALAQRYALPDCEYHPYQYYDTIETRCPSFVESWLPDSPNERDESTVIKLDATMASEFESIEKRFRSVHRDYMFTFFGMTLINMKGLVKYLSRFSKQFATDHVFYYLECSSFQPIDSTTGGDRRLHPHCPNPCAAITRRCLSDDNSYPVKSLYTGDHTISAANCIRIGPAVYEHDYACVCKRGYQFNRESKSCAPIDMCHEDSQVGNDDQTVDSNNRLCDPLGTMMCVSNPSNPEDVGAGGDMDTAQIDAQLQLPFYCVCRPAYAGYRCDHKLDACNEVGPGYSITGAQACRSNQGNECQSELGSGIYTCRCKQPWSVNKTFSFPNCYRKHSICDQVLCQNQGRCIASSDQTNFLCSCTHGWYGVNCELPDLRQWLPWGPWSGCTAPLCGGQGWESRQRECRVELDNLTDFGQCNGNSYQLQPCYSSCVEPSRRYLPLIKIPVLFCGCVIWLQILTSIIYILLHMEFT